MTLFPLINITTSPSACLYTCLYTALSQHKAARPGKEFPVCENTLTSLCKLRALYHSVGWPANISSCNSIIPMVLTSTANTTWAPEGMVYICGYSVNKTTGPIHTPTGHMDTSCLNPYFFNGYLTPSLAIYNKTSTCSRHKRGLLDNILTWGRKV